MITPGAKNVILGVFCSAALTIFIGGGTWMIKEQIDTGKHLVKIDQVLVGIQGLLDDSKNTINQTEEKRFQQQESRMNLIEFRVSKVEEKHPTK
jgi:hypothetical protein